LTFAEPVCTDDASERRQKQILREHWGDWTACKRQLDRSHRRSVITYLCDKPTDFQGAWARVRAEWRGLFLSALQSDLWNRIADLCVQRHCSPDQLIPISFKTGPLNFFRTLDDQQSALFRDTRIPLPSARLKLATEPLQQFIVDALQRRGWTLSQLKVRAPRDRFFSRARRSLVTGVNELRWGFSPDELDPGTQKLELRFVLPPGSYATLLVKRLSAGTDQPPEIGVDDDP
jgi:tRNA pseudouridine13 synthase